MRRLLRSPIGHCLALGALLFATQRLWRGPAMPAPTAPGEAIVISAATAASPRRDERIDDELLLRAALAQGFDRQDGAVRERLRRLGAYLGVAGEGDAAELEAQARRLGLELSDVTLRRHLVEMMRLAAAKTGPADLPSEAEVRAYYAAAAPRWAAPAAIRLRHVYLSRARRGAAVEDAAAALLRQLRTAPDGDSAGLGDPFSRGAEIGPLPAARLDDIFGAGFAAAVNALPIGEWAGPVPSSYGVHLVRVEAIVPGAPPPLEAVRSRVVHEIVRARGDARLAATMQTLRARYPVRIAGAGGDAAQ